MADNIRCTFEGCYQRFASVEAMKKHKAKMQEKGDDIHDFYCKKCDEDCADDIEFFIHQIQSPRHACGLEFKSEGGRDRHVGISHRQKQSLKCQGCKQMFDSAAGLIGHIETNRCEVIKRNDFHKHRAEMQVKKDAEDNDLKLEMYQGSTVLPAETTTTSTDSDTMGGTSLPADERVPWQEQPPRNFDHFADQHGSLAQKMSELAIDKYPPLMAAEQSANSARSTTTRSNIRSGRPWGATNTTTSTSSDLLGSEVSSHARKSSQTSQPPRRRWEEDYSFKASFTTSSNLLGTEIKSSSTSVDEEDHPIFKNAWGGEKALNLGLRSAPRQPSSNLLDSTSSINLMNPSLLSNHSAATRGTRPSQLPPASQPENLDPNYPHAHIQTIPSLPIPRKALDKYWNPFLASYICPSPNCSTPRHPTIQSFEQHLLSGVHAPSSVQCPSCLKRFKTTTALVAHAESGSVKCELRKTEEFDREIRAITAGLVRVDGNWSWAGNAKFESVPVEEWGRESSFW
ncbi:hypothetical protein LTR05_004502 [Lithohypha guttulata]|uniref:C2H2-type domain-containing protein n=1 Tax=Lithohypha guttulata TaxID=1690604 RepID=A0AAN7SYP9_9EURO|nr:hypothetical protein LTR05_004502 [Lithohypha guttulata]